jgi:hypothetical protein
MEWLSSCFILIAIPPRCDLPTTLPLILTVESVAHIRSTLTRYPACNPLVKGVRGFVAALHVHKFTWSAGLLLLLELNFLACSPLFLRNSLLGGPSLLRPTKSVKMLQTQQVALSILICRSLLVAKPD